MPKSTEELFAPALAGHFRPCKRKTVATRANAAFRFGTLAYQAKAWLRVSRFPSASMVVYLRFNCRFQDDPFYPEFSPLQVKHRAEGREPVKIATRREAGNSLRLLVVKGINGRRKFIN